MSDTKRQSGRTAVEYALWIVREREYQIDFWGEQHPVSILRSRIRVHIRSERVIMQLLCPLKYSYKLQIRLVFEY